MKYLESLGWKHLPGGAWQHTATGRTYANYEEALKYQQYYDTPDPATPAETPPQSPTIPNLRPDYYKPGTYEARKVIRAWKLGFELGNVLKYVCRAGKKPGSLALADLQKARTYLDFEIEERQWVDIDTEAPTP